MAEKAQRPTPDNIDRYLLESNTPRNTERIQNAMRRVPTTLQPFFQEQVDLDQELVRRFPNMPLMSTIKFRDLYGDGRHGVATLASQDGAAHLVVDINSENAEIQFSFILGSMLSMRFHLVELSDLDRRAWLNNMETRVDDIVFLWGQSRWEKDYVICVPNHYYVNLLAFSAMNFEAAVRMSPTASKSLFEWMHAFWYPGTREEDAQSSSEGNVFDW